MVFTLSTKQEFPDKPSGQGFRPPYHKKSAGQRPEKAPSPGGREEYLPA
jgi:hypothetical protein